MELYKEMKKIGMDWKERSLFSLLGVSLWAIVLWLFVERYMKIEDTSSPDKDFKNITILIISFHVITLCLTLLESYYMNRIIWLSWPIIAFALAATFLNASCLGQLLTTTGERNTLTPPYDNPNLDYDIASLVLQCVANALMTAYIFRVIRSKSKITY